VHDTALFFIKRSKSSVNFKHYARKTQSHEYAISRTFPSKGQSTLRSCQE